ncbi:MAG: hypothetical protein M3Q97_11070, partial [Bacteroidota bacterium]|nr:hypothetical protein [Bacteroidota bacterium]
MKKILLSAAFAAAILTCNAQNVTTYAGTGEEGEGGPTSTRLTTKFNAPYGVAVTSGNRVWITDENNHYIILLDANGKYYVRAGSTTGGFKDGSGAGNGLISWPRGIATGKGDTLYIVDGGNHAIRKLTPLNAVGQSQSLTTLA